MKGSCPSLLSPLVSNCLPPHSPLQRWPAPFLSISLFFFFFWILKHCLRGFLHVSPTLLLSQLRAQAPAETLWPQSCFQLCSSCSPPHNGFVTSFTLSAIRSCLSPAVFRFLFGLTLWLKAWPSMLFITPSVQISTLLWASYLFWKGIQTACRHGLQAHLQEASQHSWDMQ